METPCFPQPNLWLAGCASRSWAALRKFVVLSTQRLRVGKNLSFHCGRKAWQVLSVLRLRRLLCLFRLVPSCAVSRRLAVCAVLRNGARWCRQAAAGKQQRASSSSKQQAASSKQQAASSNQRLPP